MQFPKFKSVCHSDLITSGLECCNALYFDVIQAIIVKRYSPRCLDSHMNLGDIPFLIHCIQYDVNPLTALTLSTRFRCVFIGILQKQICSLLLDCLSVFALIYPKSVLYGWGQDSVQASQVYPHSSTTFICALVHSHAERGRLQHQCSHIVGSRKLSKMSCNADAFGAPFTGERTLKNNPYNPRPQKLQVLCTMHSDKYCYPNNRQSQTHLWDGEVGYVTPENVFPLL